MILFILLLMQDSGTTDLLHALIALHKQKTTLQSRICKLTKERDSLFNKLTEITEKIKENHTKKEAIESSFKKIQEIGINDNDR